MKIDQEFTNIMSLLFKYAYRTLINRHFILKIIEIPAVHTLPGETQNPDFKYPKILVKKSGELKDWSEIE